MTRNEYEAFEQWLTKAYRQDSTIPFALLAAVLKQVRAQIYNGQ